MNENCDRIPDYWLLDLNADGTLSYISSANWTKQNESFDLVSGPSTNLSVQQIRKTAGKAGRFSTMPLVAPQSTRRTQVPVADRVRGFHHNI